MEIQVECYSGHRGDETPRRLDLGDSVVEVAQVLDRWLSPDHRGFKLLGSDGAVYLVRHFEGRDAWELAGRRRPPADGDPGAERPA